jgi:hypothetical protein
MMKNISLILLVLSCLSNTNAQIGIKANGTAPISSAQLEVQSTNKAFYPPRMTTAQRTSFPNAPQAGAVVYDTDLNGLFTFNGSVWVAGSGLTLPYSAIQNSFSNLFAVVNSNSTTTSSTVLGYTSGSNGDVSGVFGQAINTSPNGASIGVKGNNASTNSNGYGVYGSHQGGGVGVYGYAASGLGLSGVSNNGNGGYFTSLNGYALTTGGVKLA